MTALRELREAAGVPRIVLADRAGVSAFRLYQAEAGRCELTPGERAAIECARARACEGGAGSG